MERNAILSSEPARIDTARYISPPLYFNDVLRRVNFSPTTGREPRGIIQRRIKIPPPRGRLAINRKATSDRASQTSN